jgi:hypothetical protein
MGLGNRTAHRHETVASKTAGVDPSASWDFQPGQRVMTVDGFPGTIASVEDGPLSGTETYVVTLANNMGGGEYTASQLRATSDALGSVHRTAADDYPELSDILTERPDIAPNTRMGSKTASGDEHWPENWTQCPRCYQMVDTDHTDMGDHLSEEHGLDEAGQERAWRNYHNAAKQARFEGTNCGCGQDGSPNGGHTDDQHETWASTNNRDAWGRPKMQAYDGHDAWSCNNYDCAEHPQSLYPQEGQPQGTPGWLSHDAHPDAELRRQVDQAMPRQDTEDANWLLSQQHQGPSHLSSMDHNHQSMNELLDCPSCGHQIDHLAPPKLLPQDHGEHGPWNLHGQCKKCGFTPDTPGDEECDEPYCQESGFADGWHTKAEHVDPDHANPFSDKYQDAERAVNDAFGGQDHSWLFDQHRQGPTKWSSRDTVHASNPHGIEVFEGQEPIDGADSGVDEHGHLTWGGHSPGCRDTDEYSMFGQNDAVQNVPGGKHQSSIDDTDYRDRPAPVPPPWVACEVPACNHLINTDYDSLEAHTKAAHPSGDFGRAASLRTQAEQESPCYAHPGMVHRGETCDCFHTDRSTAVRPEQHPDYGFAGRKAAFNPWAMLVTASTDPDFRFHVTASWSDVRAKAKRLRSEGRVHVTLASEGTVFAEVKGDHHVYEAGLQRLPGQTSIQAWSCGCKWGAYHWGAEDDFSRFAGRMCSHALALQYEAQSRGMFGRTVGPDDTKPAWAPRRVVVKYDIDADKNRSAPATPASGDYGRAASLSVAATLVRRAVNAGEDLGEVTLALYTAGLGMPAVQAAVNNAWGEPDPPARQVIPGPTKPKDPNDNPASSGWATHSDPDSWSYQGPIGGMTPTTASSFDDERGRRTDVCSNCGQDVHDSSGIDPNVPWVHSGTGNSYCDVEGTNDAAMFAGSPLDRTEAEPVFHESALADDAVFEPEMPKEALNPLALAPLLLIPGVGEAAAGAMVAGEAGAGAAAAGEAGSGVGQVVKKVVPHLLHHDTSGQAPQAPSAPAGGPAGPSGPPNPSSTNPLDYGAKADLHEQPEGALPATDGDLADDDLDPYDLSSPDSLEPGSSSFVSTGSVDDIVSQFQATAGARSLQGGGGGPSSDGMDLAAAARTFLETGKKPGEGLDKVALKAFTPAEQAQIINEGENVRAANLDRLEIAGTHYEPLEAALAAAEDDDEGWMS